MHTWAIVVLKPGRTIPSAVLAELDEKKRDVTFPLGGHERWSSEGGQVQAAGWWADDVPDVATSWHRRDRDVTASSGHIWIDAKPWQSDRPVSAQLAAWCSGNEVSRNIERLDGVFTLLHLRSDGSGWVTADALGLGLLYRSETAEVDVISNRAELAASLVGAAGRRCGRDLEAMGLLGFTGSLLGDRTGFDGVQVLPQASIVHLMPGRGLTVETWAQLPWWSGGDKEDPAAVIDLCLDRLRDRVRMAATSPHPVACELTGGKDSRLVLALLLAAGVAHDINYLTWGAPHLADVTIAETLAERFDLDHRAGWKRSRGHAGPSRPDQSGEAVAEPGWKVLRLGYEERLRHHAWASSGALSFWDRNDVWPPSRALSLSGLAGEVLRTNHPATNRVDTPERLHRFLASGRLGYNSAGLFTDDAAEHLGGVVEAEMLSLLPNDGDVRDAVDGFYQRGRLRRLEGLKLEIGSRNRVFPLYDLHVVRAAFSIGSEARRREELHFRLIEACVPELIRLPFAGKGWPPALVAEHPEARLIGSPADRSSPSAPSIEKAAQAPPRQPPVATAADINRMKDIDAKRHVLRSLLDLPPRHRVWDLYDRRRTLDALDKIESLPRRGRAEVHHAATVATWLDHGEQWSDVYTRRT